MITVRATDRFRLKKGEDGRYYVECLVADVVPRTRRVGAADAKYLEEAQASEFDNACVADFGVGVFTKPGSP